MTEKLFSELLSELGQRGGGRRESGAFLLAERVPEIGPANSHGPASIVAIAYYDDLDPNCLTGGITFSAVGYTALNARCRRDGLRVAADVHTHPRDGVAQSHIDASHPMVVLDGHLALIAPNYGRGPIGSEDLGAHVFHSGGWTSYFGPDVVSVLSLTRPAVRARWTAKLRALSTSVRGALRPRRTP